MYLIEKITNNEGDDRIDDRYPNRVGSVTSFDIVPMVNHRMIFRYIKKDSDDNIIEDHITVTSPVISIQNDNNYIIAHTENSIYYFKKI